MTSGIIEATDPNPPRFWWLKRISAGSVLLVIALSSAWVGWDHLAAARRSSGIAAVRERGEPVLPADFVVPDVPDKQNVVFYLNQASVAINSAADPPAATNMEYSYSPLPPEWFTVARIAVEGNQKSLGFLREARQHDQIDWGLKLNTRPLATGMLNTGLNNQRHLANLLGDSALYEHFTGNDAEALEHIRDLFHLSDAVDRQPFLIGHLVGIGIHALAMHRLQVMAPGLRLADDPNPAPTTHPTSPAEREQVRAIIAMLIERSHGQGMLRALQGERMLQIDSVDWVAEQATLLRPAYELDMIRILRAQDRIIGACTQPSYPAAVSAAGFGSAAAASSGTITQRLAGMMQASIQRSLDVDYRVRTEACLTAVSLAARMYQIDHQGRWPLTLEALVPDYLDTVPIDPFSPGRKKLGYVLAQDGGRPIVYSVGQTAKDVPFDESMLTPEPNYGWSRTQIQWRDLSRFDGPPAPATQPTQN